MIWHLIQNTSDKISIDYLYIAIYKYTSKEGFACYWTFRAGTPAAKRTLGNALYVGGLPRNEECLSEAPKLAIRKAHGMKISDRPLGNKK
jgi:hypothetical protein